VTAVTVVDYGAGNLRSLRAAFERLGTDVAISSDPSDVERAGVVVVPGVGAAGPAMDRLRAAGLAGAIRTAADRGAHVLGICLGLQLLFERSEEGETECLGLLPGVVRRIDWAGIVPHMGWNDVAPARPGALAEALPAVCYFAHTYVADAADAADVIATTELDGTSFASAVGRGRVAAVQFHPERSGPAGRALLAAFLEKADRAA
jgi:glutamine amidotransferase